MLKHVLLKGQQLRSGLSSHKTVLELSEEQFYGKFNISSRASSSGSSSKSGSTGRAVLVELALLLELFPKSRLCRNYQNSWLVLAELFSYSRFC